MEWNSECCVVSHPSTGEASFTLTHKSLFLVILLDSIQFQLCLQNHGLYAWHLLFPLTAANMKTHYHFVERRCQPGFP